MTDETIRDALWAEYRASAKALAEARGDQRGPMGLTPAHIKASPAWRAAKARHDAAHAAIRAFNTRHLRRPARNSTP